MLTVLLLGLLTVATYGKMTSGDDDSFMNGGGNAAGKYNFGLGKRAYSYVSQYKRLPVYNFGLGKRSASTGGGSSRNLYSFGLGKRDYEDAPLMQQPDVAANDEADDQSQDIYDSEEKRAAANKHHYDFGLGKRLAASSQHQYAFGLGKRLNGAYNFGLGKRAAAATAGKLYGFGLGKRAAAAAGKVYGFGLGKKDKMYSFGLGKRNLSPYVQNEYDDYYEEDDNNDYPEVVAKRQKSSGQKFNFGLGKRTTYYETGYDVNNDKLD